MRLGSNVAPVLTLFALAACSSTPPGDAPGEGALAAEVDALARAEGVPRDLVLAIAVEEGGLLLPATREVHPDDHVPVAGILELRHGAFDSLARGAALAGTTEDALRADTRLGTAAGVAVLADLARELAVDAASLPAWRPVVARLSGLRGQDHVDAYVARVFRVLRAGGTFAARGGERVVVAPHPEIPPAWTIPPPLRSPQGTPEYPGALWFQTDCAGKCNVTRNRAIDVVTIHDTEGGWNASVATLQNDPGKSVHYIVDADGSRVGQFLPESYDGWHAGNSYWNNRSIGIEHVGYASQTYAKGLYDTSVALVASIRSRHAIPLDRQHIVGHYQIPDGGRIAESSAACSLGLSACEKSSDYGGASNHRDPGYNWQWCQYMERLGGSCDCQDAWAAWNCTTDLTQAWRCDAGTLEKDECSAGCEIMAIGTPDVCHHAVAEAGADAGADSSSGSDSGADAGSGADSGSGSDSGAGGGGGEAGAGPEEPGTAAAAGLDPGSSGGCSTTPGRDGGAASAAAWLCLLGLLARRRRVR